MPHSSLSPAMALLLAASLPYFAVEFGDREPTGYAMGAITSAFHTVVSPNQ